MWILRVFKLPKNYNYAGPDATVFEVLNMLNAQYHQHVVHRDVRTGIKPKYWGISFTVLID
jgi:hypothetical protein